jgi:ATP-dependent RNA helicase DeaD
MLEHTVTATATTTRTSQPDAHLRAEPSFAEAIGPALTRALQGKGYETLTPVQQQVLEPRLAGKDLRISSQTGSGKTLAIGFALRRIVEAQKPPTPSAGPADDQKQRRPSAKPHAIVIVPTRELARQVQLELSWLYAPMQVRVIGVAGGANYRDEYRALIRGPRIVVGTPGRLLDHLKQGSIDTSGVGAVVLDEADQMLDLGFRDELEAILSHMPEPRQTHLVSATFPREVTALANRVQKQAVSIDHSAAPIPI